MQKILLLHAWFDSPQGHWYPNVKSELENKGYLVHVPFLKDNQNPILEDWKQSALENFTIDENTSIIGHSLGSVLALRLAESKKISKLVLIATWDFWDLTPQHQSFFNTLINHQKIIDNCKEIIIIQSDNDPYFTQNTTQEMAERLKARTITIKGGGHFTKKFGFEKFPEIVNLF